MPRSLFALCLFPGDRILEVDNIDLTGFTHKQAVEALCSAPPFCKLLIERSSPVAQKLDQSVNADRSGPSGQDGLTSQADIYSSFVTEGKPVLVF